MKLFLIAHFFLFNKLLSQENLVLNGNLDQLDFYSQNFNDEKGGKFLHKDTFLFRHSLNKGIHPVRTAFWDYDYKRLGRYSEEHDAFSDCCFRLLPIFSRIDKNNFTAFVDKGRLSCPLLKDSLYKISLMVKYYTYSIELPKIEFLLTADSTIPNNEFGEYLGKKTSKINYPICVSLNQKLNKNSYSKISFLYKANGGESFIYFGQLSNNLPNITIKMLKQRRNNISLAIDDVEVLQTFNQNPCSNTSHKVTIIPTTTNPIVEKKAYEEITFEGIKFEFNSYQMKESNLEIITEISNKLKGDSTLCLNLFGYTDTVGNYEYNLKLSEQRAYAVYVLFLKSGINKNRLLYKGMGVLNSNINDERKRKVSYLISNCF